MRYEYVMWHGLTSDGKGTPCVASQCGRQLLTTIYVMIYEDEKIECEKWQATITATLDAATIPGTSIIHATYLSLPELK